MKKLVYSLVVAVFVLAGCKGNSFVTQRYTKFGHVSGKTPNEKKAQLTINKSVSIKSTETEKVVVCSNTSKINESVLIPVSNLRALKFNAKLLLQQSSLNVFSVAKQDAKTIENPKVPNTFKTIFKKNLGATSGIIGTTLKIILAIIVLAIVVGVILLVVLVM